MTVTRILPSYINRSMVTSTMHGSHFCKSEIFFMSFLVIWEDGWGSFWWSEERFLLLRKTMLYKVGSWKEFVVVLNCDGSRLCCYCCNFCLCSFTFRFFFHFMSSFRELACSYYFCCFSCRLSTETRTFSADRLFNTFRWNAVSSISSRNIYNRESIVLFISISIVVDPYVVGAPSSSKGFFGRCLFSKTGSYSVRRRSCSIKWIPVSYLFLEASDDFLNWWVDAFAADAAVINFCQRGLLPGRKSSYHLIFPLVGGHHKIKLQLRTVFSFYFFTFYPVIEDKKPIITVSVTSENYNTFKCLHFQKILSTNISE